jgi:uncharacterized protein (DUF952 family)
MRTPHSAARLQETVMRWIYHLIPKPEWDEADRAAYAASSLATEGFIHCCNRDQIVRVANLYYARDPELLLLCINADRLISPLRDEDPGIGQRFPHVYGPIHGEAIASVVPMRRGPEGRWIVPDELHEEND